MEHFPYVWAAYQKGAFEGSDFFAPGLNAKEFETVLAQVVERFLTKGLSEIVTVMGEVPLAMISVEYSDRLALPHAYWFPWATPRNKVETGVKFFIQLKKNNLVLITVKDEVDVKYFQHLCKYGLLRAVGKIRDYYPDGEGAMLFQSVGA